MISMEDILSKLTPDEIEYIKANSKLTKTPNLEIKEKSIRITNIRRTSTGRFFPIEYTREEWKQIVPFFAEIFNIIGKGA